MLLCPPQEQQAAANVALARTIALQTSSAGKANGGELIHSTLKLPALASIPDDPGMRISAKHNTKVNCIQCALLSRSECAWSPHEEVVLEGCLSVCIPVASRVYDKVTIPQPSHALQPTVQHCFAHWTNAHTDTLSACHRMLCLQSEKDGRGVHQGKASAQATSGPDVLRKGIAT